jgi:hypothetical protein
MKHLAVAVALILTGCSTVQYTPASMLPAQTGGVRVLYEYPQDAKFTSLGTINAELYKPGLHAPTAEDVVPKLKLKAAAVGGNALIIRSHQVGQFDRSISVTAEVLRIDGIP